MRRPAARDAVDWEVEHHLAEMTDRLVREGWSDDEAREEAERRFGTGYRGRLARRARRRSGRTRVADAFDTLVESVRGALRSLTRHPGLSLGIVVTLALGIGANAAVFQVVDRLLLQPPLHIEAPDRVQRLVLERDRGSQTSFTYLDLDAVAGASALAGVGKVGNGVTELIVGTGADAAPAQGRLASASYFSTLGVRPHLGRFYGPDEDRVGADLRVVLGHGYWKRAFGADPTVLGRSIRINEQPATVVGVAPEGFSGAGLRPVELWIPLDTWGAQLTSDPGRMMSRDWWWLSGVVRLAPGASAEAAAEEATALFHSARAEAGAETVGGGGAGRDRLTEEGARIGLASLTAGPDGRTTPEGTVASWLLGVSLAVLLIACANVANLLLARGARARSETAVRLALGISRRRLVAQAVLQTLALALIGGGLAVLVAASTRRLIQRTLLPDIHFPGTGFELRVLLFALGVSVAAGLLAGIGPAVQSLRARVSEELRSGRRGSTARARVGQGLAVFQGAVAVVLLIGAGLFVRSLQEVDALELGLDLDRVALVRLDPAGTLNVQSDRTDLYLEALAAAEDLPGVQSAALTTAPLFWVNVQPVRAAGIRAEDWPPGGVPRWSGVGAGYFRTVGQRIEWGRDFEPNDDAAGAAPVAVVNRLMADSLWGGEAALGECLYVGDDANPPCTTIVGVAENATAGDFEEDPFLAYWLPLAQTGVSPQGLYLRSEDPAAVAGPAGVRLRGSSAVRWASVTPLRDALDPQARSWRLGATLFSGFGILALIVASVGLYSLLSFQVAQRTREIGIRAALGAEGGRILRQVVLEGTHLAAFGVGSGLVLAWFLAPRLGDLLFRVSPRDPLTWIGVAVLLLAVALIASTVPALRATRVHPTEALRSD